jgi:hypothetical protein
MQPIVSKPLSAESSFDQFLRVHSVPITALLCAYAGLRILTFTVAFPFFNNVDEQYHLISIQMYARGQWPGKDLPRLDSESAEIFTLYATPEYMNTKEALENIHLRAPLYQLPPQEAYPYFAPMFKNWRSIQDFEAQSAPLYYLLGAAWHRFGEALGMRAWQLPFWIRLLNPAAYALLMWVSYLFVRKVYPDRIFLWLGVPALLAVFPQDVYFGINRDILSAPITAVALLFMVKAVQEKESRDWLLTVTSVLVGLAFLVNVSNCVLYGVLGVTFWFWARRSPGKLRTRAWIAVGAAFASLALPVIWMLRNYAVMQDLTGSQAKIEYLGWTMKPLDRIFDHPLFSLDGLSYFLTQLVHSFWRGEYVWHMEPMRWPFADWFYLASSSVMIMVFAVHFFRKSKSGKGMQRFTGLQTLLLVFASVLFMAAISLPFDFHDCVYPSRERPFFVSGRMISGALLPFVLIYVSGLELLLRPIRKWVPPAAVLACLMVFITFSEFQVRRVAFSSSYNFFAIRAWHQKH